MPLISASDLRTRLAAVRLLDARQPGAVYTAGHLPGALHADLERDLSTAGDPDHDPARGGRHPLPPVVRFTARLGAWGIAPETDVVTYDSLAGGDAAARLWWMLRALGHRRVSVLDGGMEAALQAGLALTLDRPVVAPTTPYPADRWILPTMDADAVAAIHREASRRLLDVRAPARWRGEIEPFDPVAGRIPGSLNRFWTANLDASGRFLPPAILRDQFKALLEGVPPERLTVHCGSGATACHTLLALEVAGLSGAALYTGSWSEWCRSGRPQARG